MKIEDIEIGKYYWCRSIYGTYATKGFSIGKTDEAVLIRRDNDNSSCDLVDIRDICAPVLEGMENKSKVAVGWFGRLRDSISDAL